MGGGCVSWRIRTIVFRITNGSGNRCAGSWSIVASCEVWKDFINVSLARGTVKSCENKHQHFCAHANGQKNISPSEVKDFEERSQNHYRRADTVGNVKENLPAFS